MRYGIKFFQNGKLVRATRNIRFVTWDSAEWYLKNILRYQWIDGDFQKHGIKAEIVAQNGIPF